MGVPPVNHAQDARATSKLTRQRNLGIDSFAILNTIQATRASLVG
jgi:hypothetical protein